MLVDARRIPKRSFAPAACDNGRIEAKDGGFDVIGGAHTYKTQLTGALFRVTVTRPNATMIEGIVKFDVKQESGVIELPPVTLPPVLDTSFGPSVPATVTREIVPNIELARCEVTLLGRDAIQRGSEFKVDSKNSQDPSQHLFQFALVNTQTAGSLARPIADVVLRPVSISFNWRKVEDSTKSIANELRNCIICLTTSDTKYLLALRKPEPIEPITISFDKSENFVQLPNGPAWPWPRTTLRIDAPEEFIQHAQRNGYNVSNASKGQVRVTPSETEKYMPSYKLTLNEQLRRVDLTYEWELLPSPDHTQGRLDRKRQELDSTLKSFEVKREKLRKQEMFEVDNKGTQESITKVKAAITEANNKIADVISQKAAVEKVMKSVSQQERFFFLVSMLVEGHRVVIAKTESSTVSQSQ